MSNRHPCRRSRLRCGPGTTYLITKKTNDDLFLIRPSEEINRILLYAITPSSHIGRRTIGILSSAAGDQELRGNDPVVRARPGSDE